MPIKLPNGATIKTPEEAGILPTDPRYPQYLDMIKTLGGVLNQADSMNKGTIKADAAIATAGLAHSAGSGGSSSSAGGTLPVAGETVNGEPTGSTPGSSGGGIDWGAELKKGGGDVAALVKQWGPIALTGLNIYNAGQSQGKADQYAQGALQGTEDRFNAKAPLRALGIAGMQNPGANVPDLSNIRQLSTAGSGNPFAKALPVAGAATGFKAPPPVLPTAPPSPVNPATITPGAALPPGAAALAGGLPGAPTPTAIPKRTIPVAGV